MTVKQLTPEMAAIALRLRIYGLTWTKIKHAINYGFGIDRLRTDVFHYEATGEIREYKPRLYTKKVRLDSLRFIR